MKASFDSCGGFFGGRFGIFNRRHTEDGFAYAAAFALNAVHEAARPDELRRRSSAEEDGAAGAWVRSMTAPNQTHVNPSNTMGGKWRGEPAQASLATDGSRELPLEDARIGTGQATRID